MNWQQDEPKVIDEEMLQQAIEEQGPQGQAGDIAKKEGIQYEDVLQLRLDYRNILKIYHLWHFTTITKLQLDNNVIERIEGLENLTNLIWLDLSFNNIEVIEGLDSLVKLQDLSLFNNRISVIENLDTLQNLHILSLGNNAVAQLENVLYLRKFKNLRTLNLAGNPICDEEKYKIFVTAYLPDLVYLDYRLLDEQMKIAEMQQITDAELLEADISSCQEQANQLSETLMSLELQLVDQLEEIIKDFERNVSDMVGGFIEYCRDLENQHHEQQLEIALATLEKVVKNELEEEIPEDVAMIHDEEVTRNRKRISEIENYISYVTDELEDMRLSEDN
ncbi:dynein regulatory complex subunit 3 [Labeo rohita]|uniref:Dynein regulatory complex subunit 3 n=1 Tax=Labeo rohita TaxID=84645 RepID=A0A498MFF5_LABRO|nr:dynein regulatory complex subunit 3 [Labeo rohita]